MESSENTVYATSSEGQARVLVVDDHQDSLDLLLMALENERVTIRTAHTGQEALAFLRSEHFDLMLLDILLPDINGYEVCQIVKSHENWRGIKVIIISGRTSLNDKLLAFDVGADDYVTKPLPLKELRARIHLMLRLRQTEWELTQRNRQLEELIRISEHLNERLDLDQTAQEIVKSALRISNADRSYLLLWEEELQHHVVVAAENRTGKDNRYVISKDLGLSKLIRQTGRPVVVPDYHTNENASPEFPKDNYESAGLPLRTQTRHIGILVVTFTDPHGHFHQSDLDILTTLANQAAIALENAQLYTDLARETEKYRLIAEKASDIIISMDSVGLLTYVNEGAQTILGYTPAEMTGKPLEHFLAADGQVALNQVLGDLKAAWSKADGGGVTNRFHEFLAISKAGALVNLEFSLASLWEQNLIVSIQGIGRDVTSRKRSLESERLRMIGQIAGGVAHDLNNMLANVLGHAQLLKAETKDKNVLQTVQIIEQSALDGADTVRRIQEFTAQRMPQQLDLIDLNEVVQSTIELNRPRWRDEAQQKGMQIQVERDLHQVPAVRGNAAELREVLINLFNNAIDAMLPLGGQIGFKTWLEKAGQTVCLEVWDSGKGIPTEVRRHIFEPLYTTKGSGGTGLGLSIARNIITRLGGEILVASFPGHGTQFTIKLPAASALTDTLVSLPKTSENLKTQPVSPYKGYILIVDDENNLRNILRRALSLAGFSVDAAGSGLEALDLLSQSSHLPDRAICPYDLVFSDLGMPEMSGWELAEQITQNYPALPIVLVTGWGDQLNPERIAALNVVHTIAKPFNIQDLISLAGSLIGKAQLPG